MTGVLVDLLQQDPWTATAALALVAVVAALIAHAVIGAVLRRATSSAPILHAMVVAAQQPAGAVLPLFALQAVWTLADDQLRTIGGVRHVNGLLLIAAATWLVSAILRGLRQGITAQHRVDVEDNIQARRIHTRRGCWPARARSSS